jgi:hypothetical protein
MFHCRWPAYSAVLLMAVGVACLIALVIKPPTGSHTATVATQSRPSTAAIVAMPAKTPSAGAARSS